MFDEHKIIKKIRKGDLKSFETLVEKYKKLVCYIVFRLVSNKQDREDLCQDVFLKVYKNIDRFNFEAKLSTWIAKIANNTCINYLEKKKAGLFEDYSPEDITMDSISGDINGPLKNAENYDISKRIRDEINNLPEVYKTIITLYHLEGMTYLQISEVTELPVGTVKSYLFRARQQLKVRLISKYQVEEIYK